MPIFQNLPLKVVGTDTSKDTVTAEVLLEGYTAHDASGAQIVGTCDYVSPGTPITVTSADEMDVAIANATDDDVGKVYLYEGETTDKYENGALYIIEEEK